MRWTLLLTLLACAVSAPAKAEPSGAVSAAGLLALASEQGRGDEKGASGLVDLWWTEGWFRLGGAGGVLVLSSELEAASVVAAAAGLSFAVAYQGDELGLELRARTGLWAGAVFSGLDTGAWLTLGPHLSTRLGETVHLDVGVEAWWTTGEPAFLAVAPSMGLRWDGLDF